MGVISRSRNGRLLGVIAAGSPWPGRSSDNAGLVSAVVPLRRRTLRCPPCLWPVSGYGGSTAAPFAAGGQPSTSGWRDGRSAAKRTARGEGGCLPTVPLGRWVSTGAAPWPVTVPHTGGIGPHTGELGGVPDYFVPLHPQQPWCVPAGGRASPPILLFFVSLILGLPPVFPLSLIHISEPTRPY